MSYDGKSHVHTSLFVHIAIGQISLRGRKEIDSQGNQHFDLDYSHSSQVSKKKIPDSRSLSPMSLDWNSRDNTRIPFTYNAELAAKPKWYTGSKERKPWRLYINEINYLRCSVPHALPVFPSRFGELKFLFYSVWPKIVCFVRWNYCTVHGPWTAVHARWELSHGIHSWNESRESTSIRKQMITGGKQVQKFWQGFLFFSTS